MNAGELTSSDGRGQPVSQELVILTVTAASIGLVHTVLGPDHYVPFVVLSRARRWTRTKTAAVTTLCGIGHVGSSVLLGTIGIGLGLAVSQLELFESSRGDIAAWLLTAFGLVYMVWGLRRATRGDPTATSTPTTAARYTSTTTTTTKATSIPTTNPAPLAF